MALLEVRGLSAGYGRARVLFDVELELGAGEVVMLTGRNGAGWQTATVEALEGDGTLDRPAVLREMLRRYAELAPSNEPIHTWPVG